MGIIKLQQFYSLLLMIDLKHDQFNTDINKNNHINKHKVKYIITAHISKLLLKIFYFFSLLYVRMNGKSINFDNRSIKKATFTIKTKKYLIQMMLMLIKYQSLKKNNMVNIIHLSTLLGIMIMVLLDHCIYFFHKLLVILMNFIKIK